jgi:D-arabinose 1-dehydrogenase-like Zn-dependent alcohol dehydrogenase
VVRAAVLSAPGERLRLAELDLPEPGPGQVRVSIAATGVCHSDLSLARGTLRQAMPVVLGHESAGTVVSVGEGVTATRPATGWSCAGRRRAARAGSAARRAVAVRAVRRGAAPAVRHGRRQDVYPGLSTGGFAEQTVVSERAVLPVPDAVPLEHAALVGCAVMTGVGAVLKTAAVREGSRCWSSGSAASGLSVVQGARLAGRRPGHRRRPLPDKLELARSLGATDALEAGGELAKQVRGPDGQARRRPRLRLRRPGRDDPHLVGVDPPRRRHDRRRHRRQGHAGVLQPARAVPLRPHAAGLRLRLDRPAQPTSRRSSPTPPRAGSTWARSSAAPSGLDGVDGAFADMAAGKGARTLVVP